MITKKTVAVEGQEYEVTFRDGRAVRVDRMNIRRGTQIMSRTITLEGRLAVAAIRKAKQS